MCAIDSSLRIEPRKPSNGWGRPTSPPCSRAAAIVSAADIPGGIGLAPRLFEERDALLRRTRVLIEGCGCEEGCPACIGPDAGLAIEGGVPVMKGERKRLALAVLAAIGVTGVH